jgi:energy-coupling factor transporter ATP-binding protein EcfA2
VKGTGDVLLLPTLFLFDEPTTGLHFDDVAKLLGAFKRLLDAGHSLVVIEHNLDVIRAADWILDLGPEGGERGGQLLVAGTPGQVAARRRTPGARCSSTSGAAAVARGRPARAHCRQRARCRHLEGSRCARAMRSSCTARASTTCATSTSRSRATA